MPGAAHAATSTAATTLSVPRRLSKITTVSVIAKQISGRPRSSGRRLGSFSKLRTMSYPSQPTAPPKKRGSPGGTAGASAARKSST